MVNQSVAPGQMMMTIPEKQIQDLQYQSEQPSKSVSPLYEVMTLPPEIGDYTGSVVMKEKD